MMLQNSSANGNIDGVQCNVTNCHYHSGNNMCTANEVKVGPTFANSSADTVCATFKPRKQ